MAHSNKQTELESTEVNFKMRRSFSWDRAFFTSDGFLDAEELSSMIGGGGEGDDVKDQLQKMEEIESLEAKLFQEFEASTQKSTGTSKVNNPSIISSSGKKDSQAKKVRAAPTALSFSSTPIKTVQPPTRSSPFCDGSGGSLGNKVKSSARRSMSSRTGKAAADSPSKASSVAPLNTRIPRTSPASPVSSRSSSSTFSVNPRSKRGSSVPRGTTVNSEKPSAVNARRHDECKISKPAVRLIPKTQSSVSLKIKPPPVTSQPSSPSGLFNSSSSSTAQCPSESSSSSSSTCNASQRSKSMGNKGSTAHHRSKSTLKSHPIGQTPDQNGKQPEASHPATRSPNTSNTKKLLASKTVPAAHSGLKPASQKSTTPKPSRRQPSAKAKSSSNISRGAENIILVSPEVMDIKGKLNALKMEISMQKKDRGKETKTSRNESGKGESSSIIQTYNQTKLI